MKLTGNWSRAEQKLGTMDARFRREFLRAGQDVGQKLVEMVREGLQSQAPGGQSFDPLSPFTVMRKGTSTALAGGALEKSITATTQDFGLVIHVGIPAGAEHPSGVPMGLIARVQEYGAVIEVSPAMRAYLTGEGLHLRADTTHLTIPPRPFLGPVLKRAGLVVREGAKKALQYTLAARKR